MITKWKLKNFKSIVNVELAFAPLTILAGANSSGKSTLLQSILLIGQSLTSKVNTASVVLNGPLLRLGQFDDIQTSWKNTKPISIGWESELPGYDPNFGVARDRANDSVDYSDFTYGDETLENMYLPWSADTLRYVSCQISFDGGPGNEQKHLYQVRPRLLETQFKARFFSIDKYLQSGNKDDYYNSKVFGTISETISIDSSLHRSKLLPDQKLALHGLPQLALLEAGESLQYDISLDRRSFRSIQKEIPSAEIIGCNLKQFIPSDLRIAFDVIDEEAHWLAEWLAGKNPGRRPEPGQYRRAIQVDSKKVKLTPAVYDLVVSSFIEFVKRDLKGALAYLDGDKRIYYTPSMILERVKDIESIPKPEDDTFEAFASFIEPDLHFSAPGAFYRLMEDKKWKKRLITEYKKGRIGKKYLCKIPIPSYLQTAYTYQLHWAEHLIKYLGPLREEPKALYPLSPLSDPGDIGLRGEYCASVLAFNRAKEIDYLPPKNFAGQQIVREIKKAPLLEAVVEWLRYLDMVEDIRATDQGKLGHELQVTSKDLLTSQDLTHVGVGVSQVLPIVLLGLLSEQESTLIFEQPELHLHPRIQSLLADFFLMLTLSGKQCLIETHSEYLINHLRFRAAAAALEAPLYSEIKIYFVERKNGESHFRDVTLNEFGAISDWPEGFFDQSERTAEDILRAAFQKRDSRPPDKTQNG